MRLNELNSEEGYLHVVIQKKRGAHGIPMGVVGGKGGSAPE